MKRRNVDSSKTRRPVKKIPKLYDGFYTSLVVYVKLLLMWICVMGGDFILEFRLEYLYPIYLLLHNSYEAYKFQGIAYAILLVCIVVSVDVICLGVIPAPWLYLLGSLAVWGQVGWSLTPLGPLLLLPTLIYIDGKSIRPLPTQPLSPLAAHCLGFPLVSLAFGLKSFIGARLKQRTKNDVARQNEVLYSVLWEALPFISPPVNNNEVISNGTAVLMKKHQLQSPLSPAVLRRKSIEVGDSQLGSSDPGAPALSPKAPSSVHHNQNHHNSNHVTPQQTHNNNNNTSNTNNNNPSSPLSSNSSSSSSNSSSSSGSSPAAATPAVTPIVTPSVNSNGPTPVCNCLLGAKKKKDDCCIKLESEVRKLRSDLHVVRTFESELRSQISSYMASERNLRGDIAALQGEHESLQLKYSALLSKGQEERQSYEKKLLEERRQKENAINKQKKASQECSGDCRRKLREADREKESLRREVKLLEEKNLRTDRELQNVKSTLMHEQKNKESTAETARLMSLLSALQDQNAHLESSLSAETRLKLDLFSALGEARRQLQIRDSFIKSKEEELDEVRGQLVELLAVTDFSNQQHHDLQQTQLHCMKNNVGMNECHPSSSSPQQRNDALSFSPLIES